jgi:hypothetical protein
MCALTTWERVFYPSTAEGVENYASLEFSPTWFGSEYVTGSTKVTVTLFLPPGINPEEPRIMPSVEGSPVQPNPNPVMTKKAVSSTVGHRIPRMPTHNTRSAPVFR